MKKKTLLFFLLTFLIDASIWAHPYYVSTTEVYIHPEKKTFDVSCSMFTEDLESAIKSIYITNTDLQKDLTAKDVLNLIYTYISARFEIRIGGQKEPYILVGCESEEESTWCYLEGSYTATGTDVSITNSLLFDFIKEQTNMVHVYWNEKRQSTRLYNPNKLAEFSF